MKQNQSLTCRQSLGGADVYRYIKAVGLPISVFLLAIFVIVRFAQFGSNLVAPLCGIIWIIGSLCASLLPSHHSTILTETHVTIACYL